MTIFRHLARPLLATAFVAGGVDALRNPAAKVAAAEDVAPPIARTIPGLADKSTEQLVKLNAGVQVGAGLLLGLGKLPRLSSLALAATLVPTSLAEHRYWEAEGETRASQRTHFHKDLSMLGGLLLAALDTEGRPGVLWRTRHATGQAGAVVRRTRREAKLAAREARVAARAARQGRR